MQLAEDDRHLLFIDKFRKRFFELLDEDDKLCALADEIHAKMETGRASETGKVLLSYAVEFSFQHVVPVLLTLLKEEDMDFIEELAETMEPKWLDDYRKHWLPQDN